MADKVKFSFGEYEIATPTLEGWRRVLAVLRPGQYRTLYDMVRLFMGMDLGESEEVGEADRTLDRMTRALVGDDGEQFDSTVEVFIEAPELARTFLEACLCEDGKAVEPGTARNARLEDVDAFMEAAREQGVFGRLVALAKKWLPPAPTGGEKPPAAAQAG